MKWTPFLSLLILALLGCGSNTNELQSFQWNLRDGATYLYQMDQEGVVGLTDNAGDEQRTQLLVNAQIDVVGLDSTLAHLNMNKMSFTMIPLDSTGKGKDTSVNQMPNLEMSGMNTRGQFADDEGLVFFGQLFPLPSKDLSVGMSDTLTLRIPVSVGMFTMYLKASKIIEFTGYEELNGKKYARLESHIESSELEVPEEADGQYTLSEQSSGVHYFDLNKGAYYRSEIQVERSTDIILYDSISSGVKNSYTYTVQAVD